MGQPTVGPGEYIQLGGGFREPPADTRTANFPPLLSDGGARTAASTNGGRVVPDTSLRGLGKVIPTATLLGLLYTRRFWAKPTIEAAKKPNEVSFLVWIERALAAIARWWRQSDTHIGHEVSKGAVHSAADLVHTLDLLTLRLGQIVYSQAYLASDQAGVLDRLIHFKIPQIIQRYLRPIRLRLGRVEHLAGEALLQVRALRTSTNKRLNRIQRTEIDPLKKPVRITLPGRIHRVETDVKTIKRVQTRHTNLLKQLSFILVPALASAWLVKTLIRAGLRYTTCQNVKDVGNELCAAPPGSGKRLGRWLRQLLSLAPGFLAFPFICQIIGSVVALAGTIVTPLVEVLAEAGAALCDGKHSQAPDLPLETHALPPNPLGLSIS
jgi:hypothetical protein